jgi:hypothetical protein
LNSQPNIAIGDLIPLASIEEWHIRRVVSATRSLRQAASILEIDSGTLVRRLKRYNSGGGENADAVATQHFEPEHQPTPHDWPAT